MGFREVLEIRVIRKVVKHVYGPCLMCDRETEYCDRIPRLGKVWLAKQFEPDARRRNVRAVRIGVAPKARSLAPLEALI
jgi:predicted HD phosphohydrolase